MYQKVHSDLGNNRLSKEETFDTIKGAYRNFELRGQLEMAEQPNRFEITQEVSETGRKIARLQTVHRTSNETLICKAKLKPDNFVPDNMRRNAFLTLVKS